MIIDNVPTHAFFPVWKKYKPVLLKLMKDAQEGETQTYAFSKHEFTDVDTRKTASYPFKLEIYAGRAVNASSRPKLAQDLFSLLRMSATAVELMSEKVYMFKLDKDFTLNVTSKERETEEN